MNTVTVILVKELGLSLEIEVDGINKKVEGCLKVLLIATLC